MLVFISINSIGMISSGTISLSCEQCYLNLPLKILPDNICVLKSIGWLNDNMDANEDLIKSDVIRYVNLNKTSRLVPNKTLDYKDG